MAPRCGGLLSLLPLLTASVFLAFLAEIEPHLIHHVFERHRWAP
ncbi:MAG: hypothetical protein ACREJY_02695 [Candidatus Rokuibacteriota bacterium]